ARTTALAALGVVLLAVLAGGSAPAAVARTTTTTAAAGTPAATLRAPAEAFKSIRTYDEVAQPVRLRIPALKVDAKIEKLGLQRDGAIAVPATTDIAGWYEYGPRPGQPGPAVILGHVDSQAGPGIFFDLYRVRPGAVIRVDRADGSSATFTITQITKVPKVQFPTDL